ncbi:MAG: glycosyltransferase family 2 protein [Planctomycetota bacterium]
MLTAIVIVNYRTAGLVVECLRSLAPEVAAAPGTRVLVVDNASGDGSVDQLCAALTENGWSHWAALIAAPRNGGFAYGNNVAIRTALAGGRPPDCIWLLNPDTRVRPGALASLLAFERERPRAGIVGTRLEGPHGAIERAAHAAPSLVGEFNAGAWLGFLAQRPHGNDTNANAAGVPRRCDWVSGASMLIRRAVLDSIGLLDEGYFLYFEEVDFCTRARRAGWEVWHVPAARVVHLEAAATGVGGLRRRPAYWFESRRRYFIKNHGRVYALLADVARLAGAGAGRIGRRLAGRSMPADPPHFLSDLWRHSAFTRSGPCPVD